LCGGVVRLELDVVSGVGRMVSKSCCLIADDNFGRCSYPRLDCVGEEGRRARKWVAKVKFTIK
jgi:hypothetical protein